MDQIWLNVIGMFSVNFVIISVQKNNYYRDFKYILVRHTIEVNNCYASYASEVLSPGGVRYITEETLSVAV